MIKVERDFNSHNCDFRFVVDIPQEKSWLETNAERVYDKFVETYFKNDGHTNVHTYAQYLDFMRHSYELYYGTTSGWDVLSEYLVQKLCCGDRFNYSSTTANELSKVANRLYMKDLYSLHIVLHEPIDALPKRIQESIQRCNDAFHERTGQPAMSPLEYRNIVVLMSTKPLRCALYGEFPEKFNSDMGAFDFKELATKSLMNLKTMSEALVYKDGTVIKNRHGCEDSFEKVRSILGRYC